MQSVSLVRLESIGQLARQKDRSSRKIIPVGRGAIDERIRSKRSLCGRVEADDADRRLAKALVEVSHRGDQLHSVLSPCHGAGKLRVGAQALRDVRAE